MKHEQAVALGEHIRRLRKERKLTARGLAAKAGIDNAVLSRIETGQCAPRVETLRALAEALDVPLADMFAMAGYVAPYDLPSLTPYLRTRYHYLPEEALIAIDNYLNWLIDKHGMDPTGPHGLEDEFSQTSRR